MLPWLLLLLYSPARATLSNESLVTAGIYPVPIALREEKAVLSGEIVRLTCRVTYYKCMADVGPCRSNENLNWHFSSNPTQGGYHIVQSGLDLSFQATAEHSGQYLCSDKPTETSRSQVITVTVVERLGQLQLVATPSYHVVMVGQRVELYCNCSASRLAITWSWSYWQNEDYFNSTTYSGRKIVISRPEESGKYYCFAESLDMGFLQREKSRYHLIAIVPELKTGGPLVDYFGLAGFALSLLGMLILLVALLCYARGRYGSCCTVLEGAASSSAKAKGLTELKTAKCEGPPSAEGQGVYVNVTKINLAYVDLCPDSMRAPDIYSTLS